MWVLAAAGSLARYGAPGTPEHSEIQGCPPLASPAAFQTLCWTANCSVFQCPHRFCYIISLQWEMLTATPPQGQGASQPRLKTFCMGGTWLRAQPCALHRCPPLAQHSLLVLLSLGHQRMAILTLRNTKETHAPEKQSIEHKTHLQRVSKES